MANRFRILIRLAKLPPVGIPLLIVTFALKEFSVMAAAHPSTNTLSSVHYDLAEAVIRECLSHSDKQTVYHISFGTNDLLLPVNFIARFKSQSPLVRSVPDGTVVEKERWLTDKISGNLQLG